MHLKTLRVDLADLFYFIFLIAVPFYAYSEKIRKSSVFTLLFDDFESMTGKI